MLVYINIYLVEKEICTNILWIKMTFLMSCVRVCLVREGGGDEVRESGVRCREHGEVTGEG